MKNDKEKTVLPPRGSQINVRVDPVLKRKAKICADINGTTLESWCTQIIRTAIEAQTKGMNLPFNSPSARSGCAVGVYANV